MVTVVGISWRTITCQLGKGLMMMIRDSGFDVDKNSKLTCLNFYTWLYTWSQWHIKLENYYVPTPEGVDDGDK